MTPMNLKNCLVYKGYLDKQQQVTLLTEIRNIVAKAPLFIPKTQSGRAMSVRMTSAGKYGWYSDQSGYRYIKSHPTGSPWPKIPVQILGLWRELCPNDQEPDSCLINFYDETAKMGIHQDNDESSYDHPVLSVSLGDDALFRVGGVHRTDPTESVWLSSGDIAILKDESRLSYHGVDKIRFGSSSLLKNSGRINLTLRVVD